MSAGAAAVVWGGVPAAEWRGALLDQGAGVTVMEARGVGAGLAAALAGDYEHVWFVHAHVQPEPTTLERLLEASQDEFGECVVTAGLVLDGGGRAVRAALPRLSERRTDAMADAVAVGRLPIRYATLAHTLVRTDAARATAPPDLATYGPYADAEWTARLLRGGRGWFATGGAAIARAPLPSSDGSLRHKLRMLRTPTWSRSEAFETLAGLDPER